MKNILIIILLFISVISYGQAVNGSSTNVDLLANTNVRSARTANNINTVQVNQSLDLVAWNTGNSHSWDFDGGTGNGSAKSPSVSWSTPGEKNIVYNGDTIPRMVVVYPDLSTPNLVFDLSVDGDTLDLSSYVGGDIIHLVGTYSGNRFVIRNANGTENNRIYVTNAPNQIATFNSTSSEWGIATQNCDGLSFVGVNNTKYGFVVNNKGIIPIGVNNYVEFAGFHMVSPVSMGWLYKNDDLSRTSTDYIGITIHDVLIEDAGNEGIYFGRYTYDWEGNVYAEPYGHTMKESKIYRCKTVNCGWDGIQLGSADTLAEIHDNVIINCGLLNEANQNFGMTVNSGFQGLIYNNVIIHNVSGGAIQIFPYGNTKVYKNFFYSANVANPVFIRTTPNFCPPTGDCYTHTKTNIVFDFFSNIITGKEEAIYLLHSNTTDNGYMPNTPILLDVFNINNNIIKGTGTYRQVGGEPNTVSQSNNTIQ